MKWTTDKPTEPGWYWHKELIYLDDENQTWTTNMLLVAEQAGEMRACFLNDNFELYDNNIYMWDGEWAGPIPEPVEDVKV